LARVVFLASAKRCLITAFKMHFFESVDTEMEQES